MLKCDIQKLTDGISLTELEIIRAMECIMEGKISDAQMACFITALRLKGETIEEITGCAKVMREKAEKIEPKVKYCIDTCGTGGDCSNTFNISTAVAIIASAGGVSVAKHGNRSVSSKSGSADVLESMGINITLTPEEVSESIEKVGIGFMFAPTFHKSMKYAANVRKELGIRTIFNILGPLTNPANAAGQLLGVYDAKLTEPLAKVLLNLGIEKALVIHGDDGLDEISITSSTKVSEVNNGKVMNYEINPEMYGLQKAPLSSIVGGCSDENAEIIRSIFKGDTGPKRDIVLINAAAALYVGKKAKNISEGIEIARRIIDSGSALEKLKVFCDFTNATVS